MTYDNHKEIFLPNRTNETITKKMRNDCYIGTDVQTCIDTGIVISTK